MITAVFLRETLEAANNDAELMVMERLRQKGKYVKRLEGVGCTVQPLPSNLLCNLCIPMHHKVPNMPVSCCRGIFKAMDASGDGVLTESEMHLRLCYCNAFTRYL